MPLDPSIILGVKPAQIPSPEEYEAKSLTLEKLRQEGETGKIGLETARQKVRDEATTRQAFQGGGSETEIFNRLIAAGQPQAAMAYKKTQEESRGREAQTAQHTAAAEKTKLETALNQVAHASSILLTVKDQPSYDAARRNIGLTFGPQAVANWPAQYDPTDVQQRIAQGMQVKDHLEQRHKDATLAETKANNPFVAGPGGVPVAQPEVQAFQINKAAGQELKPHYDAERGLIVDPRTGQGTPITVGGAPVGAKPNAATQKELMTIGQQESTVDGALAAVKKTPGAFGFSRGAATMAGPVSESVRGRFDSKEESEARSYVFNIVSKVINERAGAAQSAQELARLRSFLPGEMDNAEQITNKLNGFKTYLADLKKGTTPAPPAAPPTAPGMRVTPEQQNARDNEAGAIRASQGAPAQIENDIASLEAALRGQRLDGTQRGILERELNLLKRAREIQRGGGAPAVASAPGGAPGGRTVKRTGVLNGRRVIEYSDGTVDYAQ